MTSWIHLTKYDCKFIGANLLNISNQVINVTTIIKASYPIKTKIWRITEKFTTSRNSWLFDFRCALDTQAFKELDFNHGEHGLLSPPPINKPPVFLIGIPHEEATHFQYIQEFKKTQPPSRKKLRLTVEEIKTIILFLEYCHLRIRFYSFGTFPDPNNKIATAASRPLLLLKELTEELTEQEINLRDKLDAVAV